MNCDHKNMAGYCMECDKAEIERLKGVNDNLRKALTVWREVAEAYQGKCEQYREALEEMAKQEYIDSDTKSLLSWVKARAKAVLEGKE